MESNSNLDFNAGLLQSNVTFRAGVRMLEPKGRFKQAWHSATDYFKVFNQSFVRDLIYPAASKKFKAKMDENRLTKSHQVLATLGTVFPKLITFDNKVLECAYCKAVDFREKISSLGGQFTFAYQSEEIWQVLVIHHMSLKTFLESHGVDVKTDILDGTWRVFLSKHQIYAQDVSEDPTVAILTHGNANIIARDRARFIQTLLTGMDVFSLNIRGTGHSSGVPCESGTYRDIEAVFQYLNRDYSPDHMQVVGYCLGGPNASYLASKVPTHLVLDRCFCRIGDVFGDVAVEHSGLEDMGYFETDMLSIMMCDTVSWLTSKFIINYSNETHVKKTTKSVCIIEATEDDVIPPSSGKTLWNAAPSNHHSTFIKMEAGHCDPWTPETREAFLEHQHKNDLLRSFGITNYESQGVLFDIGKLLGRLTNVTIIASDVQS